MWRVALKDSIQYTPVPARPADQYYMEGIISMFTCKVSSAPQCITLRSPPHQPTNTTLKSYQACYYAYQIRYINDSFITVKSILQHSDQNWLIRNHYSEITTQKSLLKITHDSISTTQKSHYSIFTTQKSHYSDHSLLKFVTTQKSLHRSVTTQKSLHRSVTTQKSLLRFVTTQKSLLRIITTQKSLLRKFTTRVT